MGNTIICASRSLLGKAIFSRRCIRGEEHTDIKISVYDQHHPTPQRVAYGVSKVRFATKRTTTQNCRQGRRKTDGYLGKNIIIHLREGSGHHRVPSRRLAHSETKQQRTVSVKYTQAQISTSLAGGGNYYSREQQWHLSCVISSQHQTSYNDDVIRSKCPAATPNYENCNYRAHTSSELLHSLTTARDLQPVQRSH